MKSSQVSKYTTRKEEEAANFAKESIYEGEHGQNWPTPWPTVLENCCLIFANFVVLVMFYFPGSWSSIVVRWHTDPALRRNNMWGFEDDEKGYWNEIHEGFNQISFVLLTVELLMTMGIIYYHANVTHHPKYYVTTNNKITIMCHIVGGTVAVVCLWLALVLSSKHLVWVACIVGLFLHLPSFICMLRQVHGSREITIPAYLCIGSVLFIKYIDVFLYNAPLVSVLALAHLLNVFTWVRVFGIVTTHVGMTGSDHFAVLCAGFTKIPFAMGPFGCMFAVVSVLFWNMLFEMNKPVPRKALQLNRGYADCIPANLEAKIGWTFEDALRATPSQKDPRNTLAMALYNFIRGGGGDSNDTNNHGHAKKITLENLFELVAAWGVPDARAATTKMLKRTDTDSDGLVSFEEFRVGFSFIIDSVWAKGEYDHETGVTSNVSDLVSLASSDVRGGGMKVLPESSSTLT